MRKFTTDSASIGEWDGMEEDAAQCWNRYIAPALESLFDRLADETGGEGDNYGYIASAAYEMFCDTSDDESFAELGNRVAAWINRQEQVEA